MAPGLPPRLERALQAHARWAERGVHLVGIRHHSPACAHALSALLADVQPATVLIEGPREYDALLPALGDPGTRPPVAVLSVTDGSSAFYPLAEFSPEWIALRWGLANGARVHFIDASETGGPGAGDDQVRTLQAEHHLARSELIATLAEQLGCRDHDEVWEHLFEMRSPQRLGDWQGFFADTLAWGGLARLDAERALLDADGTHAREAVMATELGAHLDAGPVMVVTGAFHTLALLDVLDDTNEGGWVRAHRAPALDPGREAWLIRYDFDRLDGLRGYGAGMPSPGLWQRAWQARIDGLGPREFAVGVVLDVVARLRAADEAIGSAAAMDAAQHAVRLAELRGREWPGRTDLTDALISCLVKDDLGLGGAIADALREVFGGPRLGDVPDAVAAPPLVAEARRRAQSLRFVIDDATTRDVNLDTHRKAAHKRRREFLATMRFVGSGFADQIGGADLVQGAGAGLLFEQWRYAWTPLVEARLIAVSAQGATLDELVRVGVDERLADENLSAAGLVRLIAELVLMGASEALEPAFDALRDRYADEPKLDSAEQSLHGLAALLGESGRLALGERAPVVRGLVGVGLSTVALLLPGLPGLDADELGAACGHLVSLRSLMLRLDDLGFAADEGEAVRRELLRLRRRPSTPARLHGCLLGLAFCDADLDAEELSRATAAHLSPGADPARVADYLLGLLQAAPDLPLHTPELLTGFNQALEAMDSEAFLTVLPDLRRAFTWLKPTETHRLAGLVATLIGVRPDELDAVVGVDPGQAERGTQLERLLVAGLNRDALHEWAAS